MKTHNPKRRLGHSCICREWPLAIALFIVAVPPIFGQQQNSEFQQQSHKPEQPRVSQSTQLEKSTEVQKQADQRSVFDFKKHGGIEYTSGEDYRLTLDVYVPEGEGPFPTVLCVHGGSWRSGTKLNWIRHAWKIAGRGFVVVAINYRHAPKHPFPAQVHDCKSAVRWIRANADQYKIDPEKLCGLGYSAGGHLVSLLGTTEPNDGLEGEIPEGQEKLSTRLQVVAAGGAPCEFSWIDEKSRALVFWLGGTRGRKPDWYRKASPTTYISKDDPPFYFFHGETDWVVPKESSKKMHEQLQAAEVVSIYKQYESYGHFALFSYTDALDPVLDFFEQQLEIQESR